jgi:hypothetical protein
MGRLTPLWESWFNQLALYVSNLSSSSGGGVPTSRQVLGAAPLSGGGALSADVTLSVAANGITNTYLAKAPALTLKGNNTGSTANEQDLTAAQVNAMLAAASGFTGINVTPDTHPASPTVSDDEFETASLDTAGTRSAGALPWTTINQTGLTNVQQQGSLQITATLQTTWGGIYQTVAAGTAYKYRAKHRLRWSGAGTAVQICGLWLYESGTGKYLTAGILNNPGPQLWLAWYPNLSTTTQTGNSATASLNSTPGCLESPPFLTQDLKWMYLEIERAGATIYMRASPSGLEGTFIDIGNVAVTTAFTTAPDSIGIGTYCINLGGGTTNLITTDWFRRIS